MKRKLPDWVIGIILLVGVVPPLIILAVIFIPEQVRRPSVESEMLQSAVVPHLLAWGKSDSDELKLDSLRALQTFDHVCYVWEYQSYELIDAEIGRVEKFFGAYRDVPENKMAFIIVRDAVAHVAHLPSNTFSIGRGGMRNCASLRRAHLVKEAGRRGSEAAYRVLERSDLPE